jgi:hypothetical protein
MKWGGRGLRLVLYLCISAGVASSFGTYTWVDPSSLKPPSGPFPEPRYVAAAVRGPTIYTLFADPPFFQVAEWHLSIWTSGTIDDGGYEQDRLHTTLAVTNWPELSPYLTGNFDYAFSTSVGSELLLTSVTDGETCWSGVFAVMTFRRCMTSDRSWPSLPFYETHGTVFWEGGSPFGSSHIGLIPN